MEKKQSDTLSDDSDKELNRRESQNFKKKDKGFKCVICSKHYKTIRARRQHMQSHMIKRKCEQCDKSYARLEKLRNHQKKVHGLHRPQRQTSASFSCTLCNKTFGREYNLNRHKAKNHPLNQQGGRRATTPAALNVDEPYDQQSVKQLVDGSDASIEKEDNGERNNDDEKENDNEDNDVDLNQQNEESALRNGVINRYLQPRGNERYDDDKCFLYCLIASLHPTAIEPERVEHYYQYEYEVNMSGISFPVTLSQIRKVERQNEHISINVFAYEDESIVPLRITEQRHRLHHVNLLWLMHEEKSHYWVKTLTMENVRLHKNIELVHTEGRLQKVTAKPAYKNTTIFNEDLVAVELYRTKVSLCKPIFCGMSVLDLSKCLMYDFWYNYIKTKYNNASTQLQMTDTDSLLFSCDTDDIYEDMNASMEYFDTSDYPEGHFLQSDLNKKVLGKMKDETNGSPITEFVGLRSKMYSFRCNDKDFKRAKGITKVTVKKELKHDCYKNTLFDETSRISSMSSLRSHRHALLGETIQKTGLSAFDDKRFLKNAVESYAYGHYKVATEPNAKDAMETQEAMTFTIVSEKDLSKRYSIGVEHSFNINDFKITPCRKL
ncbi:ZN282-like protein [Mya arenaria]|uniref:ZN282-like protein n=2 Tax=Mya arenaria TaxID=6604 RepID=A0ABY7FEB1_MYAAR|nr:ZN282-like protein [Mya arenaria]